MLGAAHAPQAFAGIVTSQLRKAGKVGCAQKEKTYGKLILGV